jgi:hypothetical protein
MYDGVQLYEVVVRRSEEEAGLGEALKSAPLGSRNRDQGTGLSTFLSRRYLIKHQRPSARNRCNRPGLKSSHRRLMVGCCFNHESVHVRCDAITKGSLNPVAPEDLVTTCSNCTQGRRLYSVSHHCSA